MQLRSAGRSEGPIVTRPLRGAVVGFARLRLSVGHPSSSTRRPRRTRG